MDVVFLTNDDDWVFIYVNDEIFYSGHDIPDFIWLRLLVGAPVNSVRRFVVDFQAFPETYDHSLFSKVPLDNVKEEEV